MEDVRDQILEELRSVRRAGMRSLIQFLESSDFFTAPASRAYHEARPGGLARHSWNVYTILKEKVKRYEVNILPDSVVVCGLLHDVCKIGIYKKEGGRYVIRDEMPLGHGEKSVFILQRFIKLTEEEMAAIRWHMGAFEAGLMIKSHPAAFAFQEALQKYPLVVLLHTADLEATYMVDERR